MFVQPLTIGDVTLAPQGQTVRITIAAQHAEARWSLEGASVAVGYLLGWIDRHDEGIVSVLDMTIRELLEGV
jgi:hypothetical protein